MSGFKIYLAIMAIMSLGLLVWAFREVFKDAKKRREIIAEIRKRKIIIHVPKE